MFAPGASIPLVLQVRNVSGLPTQTLAGFGASAFWSQLAFEEARGGWARYRGGPELTGHQTTPVCRSRNKVLQQPTAIPVALLETLPETFGIEATIEDARALYDLARPGRYTVQARVTLFTFDPSDPDAVIKDCDDFRDQAVGNMAIGAAVAGRRKLVVMSNALEFVVRPPYTFSGFAAPLTGAGDCPKLRCRSFQHGGVIPVRFGLLDTNGTAVDGAIARIRATQRSGSVPFQEPGDLGTRPGQRLNHFEFDPARHQYTFNLDSKRLTRGVWRIDAQVDDGTVHSVDIELR